MKHSAFAILLVTACASIDPSRGHDQVSAQVESRLGSSTGWDGGAPDDATIAQRVDDLLKPGLDRHNVVAIALLNNRRLQATYESLDVAQAEMLQAGLLKNPSFSGSIGFPLKEGLLESELAIVQDFLDVFLLPMRKRIAADQFGADVARVTQEALNVAAEAEEALIELQTAQAQFELDRTLAESASVTAELAAAQRKAGNLSELDLVTWQAVSADAAIAQTRSEQRVADARERLNVALGLFGPQTRWAVREPLAAPPNEPVVMENAEARAIRARYDLAAARIQADLFERAVSVARATRATGVIEVGFHTHNDPNGPKLAGPTLSIELPIFDQRTALIARLEAQARQSHRLLDALSVEIRADVRRSVTRLQRAAEVVRYSESTLLPLRRRALEQSQLQYNAMQLGLYGLLAAKDALSQAQKDHLTALRDFWTARIELQRALGGRVEGSR